ncbi:hypothetical protein D9756_001494 [Leucocoprinus leucothites]|uniref:Uncharacterized protein n=1 Tax=Leucocoprinus leucothites TaxID=201217 RepID=A0A8H5G405_9AGAR|nr:hypothetical protein D9756_001494 [Leucoagaricus leucothites]
MSSSQVPVFPLNVISFVADRSITNSGDVLKHISAYEDKINSIKVDARKDGPDEVYICKESDSPQFQGGDVDTFKLSIGPLETSIAYNLQTQKMILEVFLVLPVLGPVLVGASTGSLKDGVSVKIGYESVLTGEVDTRLKNKRGILGYEFEAFGKRYDAEVKLF